MSKNPVLYKSLVIGVLVLFIGFCVQPAIAKVEPGNSDSDYYDVNIEFCGLGKNHTVQLTKQQLEELDLLFETIREQLNKTESKEEAIQFYNNAIERLDDFGLLGNYSIRDVQKLVIDRFQKQLINRIMGKVYDNVKNDNNTNTFCLIAGVTTKSFFLPPTTMMLNRIIFLMLNLPLFFILFLGLPLTYNLYRTYLGIKIPFTLGSGISLGLRDFETEKSYPSEGWIQTLGIFGNKKWEGKIYGHISEYINWVGFLYIGVIGFIGIKIINFDNLNYYYLGFTPYVNIDYEYPS